MKKVLICYLVCVSVLIGNSQDFSLVIIPDTQYMTLDGSTGDCSHVHFLQQCMGLFWKQADWIVASKDRLNIHYVAHVGDLVEDGHDQAHWERANGPMTRIEDSGIPYGIVPGNHDFDYWNGDHWSWTRLTSYNTWFPKSRYQEKVAGFQEGYPEGSAANHYTFFEASGMEFMVLSLQYNPGTGARDWADAILKQFSHKRAIINTHDVNNAGIYDLANSNNNVFLVVSGHYCAREWTRKNSRPDGSVWMDIMSDYQGDGSNGWGECNNGNNGVSEGLLRYYQFRPLENMIYAYTYSPLSDTYKTIPSSQFSWEYKMEIVVANKKGFGLSNDGAPMPGKYELKHIPRIHLNPSRTTVVVEGSNSGVTIFNSAGQRMLVKHSTAAEHVSMEINIAHLPRGMYLVKADQIIFKFIR